MWKSVGLAFLLLLFGVASANYAQEERILSFHSDVHVKEDGKLEVTETIRVIATNNKIKRGIFREFPTLYKSKYMVNVRVPFEVVSVQRNDRPERFHTETGSNGVVVYIGSEEVRIPKGEHTYQLKYTTDYQLGFFDTHDELYWNVTGNGWRFAIDEASCTVHLPLDIPREKIEHEGYTGRSGSKDRNLESSVNNENGTVNYKTTSSLSAYEGLTIVASFPKGFVRPPSSSELRSLFFWANMTLWVAISSLIVVVSYFLYAWVKVGRDPPGGLIYPQFEPPLNLPPACVRYIWKMGYDRKCFTAALINLGVKGRLKIEEPEVGPITLRRTSVETADSEKLLSPGEKILFRTLLSTSSLDLQQSNHHLIGKAVENLGKKLALEYNGRLFHKNRKWLIPGWILSGLAVFATGAAGGLTSLFTICFFSVWLSIWTIACSALGMVVINCWRSVLELRNSTLRRLGSLGPALFVTAFAMPFFLAEIIAIVALIMYTTIWLVPLLICIITVNVVFWKLITRRTMEGRRVLDGIEGFRMYLLAAEQQTLQALYPPKKTPELFEKYLPYALALDVENEWAEQFTDKLVIGSSGLTSPNCRQPSWYRGNSWSPNSIGTFTSAVSTAIASSSTAPGTSSGVSMSSRSGGGGGGGFSGGGGGGGGGGGW